VNGTAQSAAAAQQKRSARELRQGGSDYRCCIPALAGFVSPQSIAPDGKHIFQQDRHHAMDFCKRIARIDELGHFCLHRHHEMARLAFAPCNAAGHKNNDRHDQAQHRDRERAVALLSRAIAVSRTAGLP
jgi:hypothetical protein